LNLVKMKIKELLIRDKAIIVLIILQTIIYYPLVMAPHNIIYIFTANNWMPFFPKQTSLDLLLSAWTPAGFGGPAFHTPGFFIIYITQILISDQYIAEILFLFLPYWIASISMLFVLRKIWSNLFWPVLVAASLVYAYNWVTFDEIGNLTFLFEYAVAPLVFWLVFEIGRNSNNLRRELFLASILFIGTLFYSFVGLSLIAPAFLAGLICRILSMRKASLGNFLRYFARLFISLIFYVIISLPFSFPQITGLVERGGSNYYSTVGYEIAGTYLAQIGPRNFPPVFPYTFSIFSLLSSPNLVDFFMIAGATILGLAFLVLIGSRNKAIVASLTSVFLLFAILLELVIYENPIINTLYSKIPILIAIDGVVPYFTVIGYIEAILVTFAICATCYFAWTRLDSMNKLPRYLKYLTIILLVTLLSTPFIFSHQAQILSLNTLNQQTFTSGSESYQGTIPAYLANLTQYFSELRQTSLPFRVLWLPQENWLSGMMTTLSVSDQFTAGSLQSNPVLFTTLRSAINDLTTGNSGFGSILAYLGFRYIVILKTLSQSGSIVMGTGPDSYISGSPSFFISNLVNQSAIKLKENSPYYNIYEVQNLSNYSPSIFWLSENQSIPSVTNIKVLQTYPENSPSSYSLQINSSGSTWLIFAENFDPGWTASTLISGTKISLTDSVAMGWANSFHIPGSGIRTVTLTYSPQTSYDDLLIIWAILAFLLVIFFAWGRPILWLREGPLRIRS
jgi:hypothetical protein